MFRWTDTFDSGAPQLLLEELRLRASQLHRTQRDGDVAWGGLSIQHTGYEARTGGGGEGTLPEGQIRTSSQLQ